MDLIDRIQTSSEFSFASRPASIEEEIFSLWEKESKSQLKTDREVLWNNAIDTTKASGPAMVTIIIISTVMIALSFGISTGYWTYYLLTEIMHIAVSTIIVIIVGLVIGIASFFAQAIGLLKLWDHIVDKRMIPKRKEASAEVEQKKMRFSTEQLFFYQTVANHLTAQADHIRKQISASKSKLEIEFKNPHEELKKEIHQVKLDLNAFQNDDHEAQAIIAELERSITVSELRLNTISPQEQDLLNELGLSENRLALLDSLIPHITSKKNFYEDNASRLERVNDFIKKTSPNYYNPGSTPENPRLNLIKDELEEINSKLFTSIQESQRIIGLPLLSGAKSHVDRLIESGSVN